MSNIVVFQVRIFRKIYTLAAVHPQMVDGIRPLLDKGQVSALNHQFWGALFRTPKEF